MCPDHDEYDGECDACESAFYAECEAQKAEYDAATPSERRRVIDPEGARAEEEAELMDAGRGHLVGGGQ